MSRHVFSTEGRLLCQQNCRLRSRDTVVPPLPVSACSHNHMIYHIFCAIETRNQKCMQYNQYKTYNNYCKNDTKKIEWDVYYKNIAIVKQECHST